jgi:Chaperone of endosialidase
VGGKSATSTSQVAIPPQVLAQYQSVNAAATQAAQTPFQTYSGPFVAPVNAEQQTGIAGTTAAANEAQPYYGAATGTLGSAQAATSPVNTAAEIGTAMSGAPVSGADIDQYLSPYLGTVLGGTEQEINVQNQQAEAGQLGNAITSGAFGSDRTGIAAANLSAQQEIAAAPIYSGIANTGYQSALSTALGEQQVGLGAAGQLATIGSTAYGEGANTASELGALGTGAQTAALTGAGAEIGAGTVEQQTQQAQDTALYNQFLQQQSYPFQVDQFLANIAEGTGSLSGSTTTTTQPGGFFSDRRLKRDIKKIGRTFDGQDIVTYKMGDDERTRIGLIAQDVEKKHPHAVGIAGGFKMVDYGRATEEAANRGHFYAGGVVPFRRVHRDTGGGLSGVLQAQQQMYAQMPGSSTQRQINPTTGGGGGRSLPVSNAPASPPPSGSSELSQTMGLANQGYKLYKNFNAPAATTAPTGVAPAATLQPAGVQGSGVITSGAPESLATPATAPATTGLAAPAAADAAAPAATDAVVSAAAPAVAGAAEGAVDAGAVDTAAALATEYAAADLGVGALALARRGGRIGHADGGVPYLEGGENDAGELNIPEDANTNTLKAAPAAGKQPTGFQDILYMGNPQNTSSLVGSTFSNEALAAGGVAGRRHYDDGGGLPITDPSIANPPPDPVDTATVNGAAPQASAAPATAPSAPSPNQGGVAGWWDRNKGTVLPILSGIGAMGTAKTVHPGVALAAGLAGGAEAYTPIQEGLATAQKTQAEAQGQMIKNQTIADARDAIRRGLPGLTPQTPTPGGVAARAATPAAAPRTVNPAPGIIAGAGPAAAPSSGAATTVPLGATAQASSAPSPATSIAPTSTPTAPSSDDADTAAGVGKAARAKYFVNTARTPEEMAQFEGAKNQDALIRMVYPSWGNTYADQANALYEQRVKNGQQVAMNSAQQDADTRYATYMDPNASPAAKAAALVHYNAVRQWTGDTTAIQGGFVKNTRTQQPEIGTLAAQGLTPEQMWSPVVVGNELPRPAWQAYGMPKPAFGPPGTQGGAAPTTPPQSPQSQAPPPMASTGNEYLDRTLRQAQSDVRYRENPGPPITNQTTQKLNYDQQETNLKNRADLAARASAITDEQSQVTQLLGAAKQIMQSKGAPIGGFPGLIGAYISQKYNGVDASNYAEVAKYLMNAAVMQGHTNFPNATQSEFAQQVANMSPSLGMPTPAMNNLIDMGLRTSKYMTDSAGRATLWAKTPGVDPLAFNDYNQNYFNRAKTVNATKTAIDKNGNRVYLINNKWTS